MRYMNNNKSETKRIFRSNKNFWQRAISFITVFSLVVNTMYSRELFGLFNFDMVLNYPYLFVFMAAGEAAVRELSGLDEEE